MSRSASFIYARLSALRVTQQSGLFQAHNSSLFSICLGKRGFSAQAAMPGSPPAKSRFGIPLLLMGALTATAATYVAAKAGKL